MIRTHLRLRALALSVLAVQGSVGCKSKETVAPADPAAPSAAPSAMAPKADLHVAPEAEVRAALNPSGEKPYSGPIGGVRGVVHVSGDTAPDVAEVLRQIPRGTCDDARAFYGKAFREGPARELGDVLVALTGYKGYLPAPGLSKLVRARGCAFESRTVALVFGQRLDVQNLGRETFIPHLLGGTQAALVVAMPGGEPIELFPAHVGQYVLADETHDFARADVFVLKFPTAAVTGLDGKFDFSGIPAGEVTVSAYSPGLRKTESKQVSIVAGETAEVEFTLPFTRTLPTPGSSASAPSTSPPPPSPH